MFKFDELMDYLKKSTAEPQSYLFLVTDNEFSTYFIDHLRKNNECEYVFEGVPHSYFMLNNLRASDAQWVVDYFETFGKIKIRYKLFDKVARENIRVRSK